MVGRGVLFLPPPRPFSVITRCQRLAAFAKPGTWFCRDATRDVASQRDDTLRSGAQLCRLASEETNCTN